MAADLPFTKILDRFQRAARNGERLHLDVDQVRAFCHPEIIAELRFLSVDEMNDGTAPEIEWDLSARSHVYFLRAGETGPIKIGFARDPWLRRNTLQVGHAELLTIVAAPPGYIADERRLHHFFAAERIRGEWYRPSPRLLAYIRGLRMNYGC